ARGRALAVAGTDLWAAGLLRDTPCEPNDPKYTEQEEPSSLENRGLFLMEIECPLPARSQQGAYTFEGCGSVWRNLRHYFSISLTVGQGPPPPSSNWLGLSFTSDLIHFES